MVFSVVVLLLKYNFCLRNVFWCLSSKNSLRALSESSKTYYFLTVFTPLLSTMVSMSHIYCWQIAPLYWFCLSPTWDVKFGSNLSKFESKNLKASLMSFTCSLFSDKVRCFNQSKRALYENFIINQIKAYRTGYQTIPNFSQLLNASSSVSTSHCK